MPPRGLGRGLESLIPASIREEKPSDAVKIPISKIRKNPRQPRRVFNEERLKELADSIRSQGLIQAVVVRPVKDPEGGYELVVGERRWRAAQMAGLSEIPAIIREISEQEQFQIALIENLQREDLNPIEEAAAFQKLMEEFHLTQEGLSEIIGKGRPVVANTLRLLTLPQTLQDAVSNGTISAGHARSLVSMDNENLQKELAEKILREHLTVRDIERIVAELKGGGSKKAKALERKDPEIRELEKRMQQTLGTKVQIKASGKGKTIKGFIKIFYFSLEDLERLAEILRNKKG